MAAALFSDWMQGPKRTAVQLEAGDALLDVLSNPLHDHFRGAPSTHLAHVGFTLVSNAPSPPSALAASPPSAPVASPPSALAASLPSAPAGSPPSALSLSPFGLPAAWTAQWQALPPPPTVESKDAICHVLVPGDGLAATLDAVAVTRRHAAKAAEAAQRAAAAAAALAAPSDATTAAALAPSGGASVAPAASDSVAAAEAALAADLDLLASWRWRGTTSTKLTYLLSQLAALPEHEKAIVFTSHQNVLYYVCQALTTARVRHLWYNTQLVRRRHAPRATPRPWTDTNTGMAVSRRRPSVRKRS